MKIMIEAKPTHIYDERSLTVVVRFVSEYDAIKYRAEAKYKKRFLLLPNISFDKFREDDYRFSRVYQVKVKINK